MVVESSPLDTARQSLVSYGDLAQSGVKLQKELEAFYLQEEKRIRKRVSLIDEMQACIADERRCLEVQHQECREQISAARRAISTAHADESKLSQFCKRVQSELEGEEARIDAQLAEVASTMAVEDKLLHKALDKRDALEKEEQSLESRERAQLRESEDLDRALREIKKLASEIEYRKLSLSKKDDMIAEWNHTLEMRELELVRCQDQLRDELRAVEAEEYRLGFKSSSGGNAVISIVSQRELMDNNDMSIEHETDKEEIDLEY